jgi:formylmethanofuran dehydrogenase subunit D
MLKLTKKVSYRAHSKNEAIPCIFIEGLHLKKLGLFIGDQVKIDYQFKKIIITVLDAETKPHNG